MITSLAGRHEKNRCDRLWAVRYVRGKYLVLADAHDSIFALFFMDTIACASEGYL